MDEKKAIVRFIRKHKVYNEGERAGFVLAEAKRMIELGVALLSDDDTTLADLGLKEKADDAAPDAVDTTTHELTVEQCVKHVAGIEDLEALQALWDGEREHPNHEDGRKGVLEAIRARAEELKPEDEEAEE